MKNVMKMMALALMLLATSLTVSAQDKDNAQKQRMTREQFATAQAQRIAEQLALDDATTKRFVETYGNYQKELWSIRPNKMKEGRPGMRGGRGKGPQGKQGGQQQAKPEGQQQTQPKQRPQKKEMTEAETDKAIKARFEQSQKILNLREKYYNEYSKFLSAKQIQRVYTLEKQMMQRLAQRGGQHKGGPRGGMRGDRQRPGKPQQPQND